VDQPRTDHHRELVISRELASVPSSMLTSRWPFPSAPFASHFSFRSCSRSGLSGLALLSRRAQIVFREWYARDYRKVQCSRRLRRCNRPMLTLFDIVSSVFSVSRSPLGMRVRASERRTLSSNALFCVRFFFPLLIRQVLRSVA